MDCQGANHKYESNSVGFIKAIKKKNDCSKRFQLIY